MPVIGERMQSEVEPAEPCRLDLDSLPAPPAVAGKIILKSLEPEVRLDDLASLVAIDQSLTLRVLRMANSAGIGYGRRVESVPEAVSVLGITNLRHVALSASIRESLLGEASSTDPELTSIWRHSVACAVTAGMLAARRYPDLSSLAFTAALLHDCGKLAFLQLHGKAYEDILCRCRSDEGRLSQVERRRFGIDHGTLGGRLLTRWGMPAALSDVALLHHQPPPSQGGGNALPALVALADRLSHEAMLDAVDASMVREREELARDLGFTSQDVREARDRVAEEFARHAEGFDLEGDPVLFYLEALDRARGSLLVMHENLAAASHGLARRNAVLKSLSRASVQLADTRTPRDVVSLVAAALVEGFAASRASVYALGAGGRLEGLVTDANGSLAFGADVAGAENARAAAFVAAGGDGNLAHFAAEHDGEVLGGFATHRLHDPEIAAALSQLSALQAAALGRLRLERRLRERAERLGEALSTVKGYQEKLLQAERLAAVGQLAAGVAHEINNPLSIVSARMQLFEAGASDEKTRAYCGVMREQLDRIAVVLRGMLEFARPDPADFLPAHLGDCVEAAVRLVRGQLEGNGASLVSWVEPGLPLVLADRRQLEQVLLNLLINAGQALDKPGGKVQVRVERDVSGEHVRIEVEDSGTGIDPENLSRVFDPFYTTKAPGEGTGLGLAVSQAIVRAHRGELRVRSRKGKGSVFSVLLPVEGGTAPSA